MDSIDPVIEYLFGIVFSHYNSKMILENLTKSDILNICDFFYTREYDLFKMPDQNLLRIFKKFLFQKIKEADTDFHSIPIDGCFWFDIPAESFKIYRKEYLNAEFSPIKRIVSNNQSVFDSPNVTQRHPKIVLDSSFRNVKNQTISSTIGNVSIQTINPAMKKVQKITEYPRFSGQVKDWKSFERRFVATANSQNYGHVLLLDPPFEPGIDQVEEFKLDCNYIFQVFSAAWSNGSNYNIVSDHEQTRDGRAVYINALKCFRNTAFESNPSTTPGSTSLFDNTNTTGPTTNVFNQSNPSTTVFGVFGASTSPTPGASTGMFGTVQSPQQSGTNTVPSTTIRNDDDICEVNVAVIESTEDHGAILRTIFDFQAINALLDHTDISMVYDSIHDVNGPYAKAVFQEEFGQPDSTCANDVPKDDFAGGHADPTLTYTKELAHTMGINKAGLKIVVYDPGGHADPNFTYFKEQHTIKTSTFGSEIVAGRIADEKIMEYRYKLRMMGMPIEGPPILFCDNKSMVTYCSILSSTLKKRHNALF